MSPLFSVGRVTCHSLQTSFFFTLFICFAIQSALAVNVTQCLTEIKSGEWGTVGGTDNKGNPVSNISKATGITYDLCKRACGSGPESFQWSGFSQQFTTWLLPNLTLISQLPYGTKTRLGNFTAVVLALGSPMLAAYSLALTLLNGRWVTQKDALLNSLVVLHHNDEWWKELADALDYTQAWSTAAAASVAWIIIVYILSIIEAFDNLAEHGDPTFKISNVVVTWFGEGSRFLWMWLLPIVVGWLQLSPKCDWIQLCKALEKTHLLAFVATPTSIAKASTISEERAFMINVHPDASICHQHRSLACDEELMTPIFNYTRLLGWVQVVEDVAAVFQAAAQKAHFHIPVDPEVKWKGQGGQDIHPDNRTRTIDQVVTYCQSPTYLCKSRWGPDVYKRLVVASFVTLLLQWGTMGAAVLGLYFTPTVGLGCRSGSYLIYGVASTFIWVILLASSALSHYTHPHSHRSQNPPFSSRTSTIARLLSIILRRLGKVLATCNAVWLMVICLFQFSNFFCRCYCASFVWRLGSRAFVVIQITPTDLALMKAGWTAAVTLASSCSLLFVCFVNLFVDNEHRAS
ncbi:hypothetical protein JAAARDRAFT_55885 [Jaapia argillacea MUCL 33604]|uniref:Uncharacterized protein n=1 Tax=Jaapia argillacea MUCL 33604 TaxID=933084 RepID=A0A067Q4V1_9AGAM|nr:hypothetical protein JAAARDRAFT_55885 [Jaapia argillacea MUCL 33604]